MKIGLKAFAAVIIFVAGTPSFAQNVLPACMGQRVSDACHRMRVLGEIKSWKFKEFIDKARASNNGAFAEHFGLYAYSKSECPTLKSVREEAPRPWEIDNNEPFKKLRSVFVGWGDGEVFNLQNYYMTGDHLVLTGSSKKLLTVGKHGQVVFYIGNSPLMGTFAFIDDHIASKPTFDSENRVTRYTPSKRCDEQEFLKVADEWRMHVISSPYLEKAAADEKAGNKIGFIENAFMATVVAPEFWASSYWMARKHLFQGDKAKALEAVDEALSRNPDSTVAKSLQAEIKSR